MKTLEKISDYKSSAYYSLDLQSALARLTIPTQRTSVCSLPTNTEPEKQTFLNMAGFGSGGPKKGTSSRAVTETWNHIRGKKLVSEHKWDHQTTTINLIPPKKFTYKKEV